VVVEGVDIGYYTINLTGFDLIVKDAWNAEIINPLERAGCVTLIFDKFGINKGEYTINLIAITKILDKTKKLCHKLTVAETNL
jgi:hypothetical protein